MDSMLKRLSMALAVSSALTLAACGGDGDGGGGDADAGTDGGTTDTSGTDGGIEIDTGNDTGGTNLCGEGGTECTRTSECRDALGDNFACEEGCCEEQDVPDPCTRHLADCESAEQSNDRFICDEGLGQCIQRCADAETEDASGSNCPLNSFCFQFTGGTFPTDPTTGATLDGGCIPGDCTSMFDQGGDGADLDPAACDGVDAVLDDVVCESGTCICTPVGNGASYCQGVGTAAEGDACGDVNGDGTLSSDENCDSSTSCFRGTCVAPCNQRADGGCGDGEVCNPAFDVTSRNQPGVCAADCGEFSADECPDSTVCTPAWGRFGVNDWLCTDTTADGPGEGESCNIDLGNFGDCQEGLICVVETEDATEGTCTALCDPENSSDGAFASCGGEGAGAELIGATAFGEGSDYLTLAADTYGVQVRSADDGSLVTPYDVEVVDGEVVSLVAAIDPDSELDIMEFVDFADGETLPATGLRAIHASGAAGEVDAYLGVAVPGIEYGAPTEFVELGESMNIHVLADGAPLVPAITEFEPEAGTSYNFIAYLDSDDAPVVEAVPVIADLADLSGGPDSILRLFHGATGAPDVDVYAGCASADACDTDPIGDGGNLLATDVAYGDTGVLDISFPVFSGPEDVYIFVAGDDPATDAPLFEAELDIPAGEIITGVAYFDESDALDVALFVDPLPAADESVANVIHAIDGAAAVDVILEDTTPVLSNIVYGDALGGEESAYVELDAGFYSIQLRATGADASDDPAWLTGAFELADGDLSTAIVTDDADGITGFFLSDLVEVPNDGEGSVRLVHAADGAPAVTVSLPGESTEICSAITITGLGFCNERCTPYPRVGEGNYECEGADQTCFPTYEASSRATEIAGVCQTGDPDGAAPGEACDDDGFFGGGCADFALCADFSEAGGNPVCNELCEPFAYDVDQCGEGSCNSVQPLFGNAFSFCETGAQPGAPFDRCTEEGVSCAADGTICLDMTGSGAQCWPVCRGGAEFDDCASFEGRTCRTGELNPEVVPGFMGLCR